MAYKDILIYLDPSPGAEDRLRFAAGLAQTHMARLIGVDASSNEAFLGAPADRAIQIGDRFAEATRAAGIVGHLVAADDPKSDHFPDYSHCVDLAIAPRPEADAKKLVRSFLPDQLVMNSGGPVLILPQYWNFGPVGQNIVVAWNASREATRAVHDSMPLLKKARKVTGRSGMCSGLLATTSRRSPAKPSPIRKPSRSASSQRSPTTVMAYSITWSRSSFQPSERRGWRGSRANWTLLWPTVPIRGPTTT